MLLTGIVDPLGRNEVSIALEGWRTCMMVFSVYKNAIFIFRCAATDVSVLLRGCLIICSLINFFSTTRPFINFSESVVTHLNPQRYHCDFSQNETVREHPLGL